MPPGSPEVRTFLGLQAMIASPAMRRLLEFVERAAMSGAAILITGESGSGKELVARAIHHFSQRSGRPWVDISCAALPDHLIESELFGYEKGAFSGAEAAKPGLFEMAQGGTLFLDEVGELDLRMQAKLLRVLDGSPYYRLGGTKKVFPDARIVAATNRTVEELHSPGRFRHDLFHRLSQVTIHVPPLRERSDDVLPLASHFLAQVRPGCVISPAAERLLLSHSWPGNIRELRNAVTRAALFAASDVIEPGDLPIRLEPAVPRSNLVVFSSAAPERDLNGLERRTIFDVLRQTNGHRQRAADILGISRRTLSRKLKAYGEDRAAAACGAAG